MPSIPNPSELAGITFPLRPSQARIGAPRSPAWRSRTLGNPNPFYCVATIEFDHAIVDFETFSVVIGGRRLLLEGRDFALCLHLLWAEGESLTFEEIIDRLGIHPTRHTRVVVARVIKRLVRKFSVNGLDGLLESSPGMCRLRLQPPGTRASFPKP